MKFNQSLAREIGILWLVTWWPEDAPIDTEPMKSYVVAPDANAALQAFSELPGDWVSVERVGNGGVYIQPENSLAGG